MEVEIMSTQTIRPAAAGTTPPSSTPATSKKRFTLSIFDQLMPPMYIRILLFYSATDLQISAKSDRLKKSLSETLFHFFPLAGRISDNIHVVADEETAGVEYIEALVRGELKEILSPPNLEAIGELLPAVKNISCTEKLLVVRQSVFECGGMAIGICVSHKVADAAAVSSFLSSWSANARGGGGGSSDMAAAAAPYLSSASRFPPSDAFATSNYPDFPEQKNTTRRFVLSGSQVASLKAKSRSESVANPTRVEAVVSLIWKCLMRSKSSNMKNPSPSSSSSGAWQYVNLRNRINPPLLDNTFGNILGFFKTSTAAEEDNGVASLVSKMRHAKEKYMRDPGTTLSAVCESFKQLLTDENGDIYSFTSVCNLDLYGNADFGWGKPIWATFCMNYTNIVVLSDTVDDEEAGGVQVWLSLSKQQMDVFEKDPLLLSYATPNPSIIDQYQTGPHRRFARVSSPGFHSRLLISRPNSLSQILRRTEYVPHYYSTRPLYNIHSRVVAPSLSIRIEGVNSEKLLPNSAPTAGIQLLARRPI